MPDTRSRFEDSAPWTAADSEIATNEGWDLFNADSEPVIQKDDMMDVFPSDDAALEYVISWARAGSLVHARALQLHFGVVQWEEA